MSSSTRPKPRPRPRPRALVTASVTTDVPPSSSPGPSSATPNTQPAPTAAAPVQSIEDEDAMFLRNRGRTAQMWSQLSKLTAETETRKRKSSSDSSDSEREGGSSPRPRNRKKRPQKKKNDSLPDWTRMKPDEITISSDDDDDIVSLKGRTPAMGRGKESSQGKHKHPRSRSVTPPPALPQYAIQRAQEAVQQLVGSRHRAPSPTYGADDSMDTIALDPELASIARRVHTEVQMHNGPSVNDVGGPELVQIRIVWKPHPLNPNGRADSWGIRQKRHDNFYALFGEVADLASVLLENIVMTHEGKRVFPSSNPHGIGIWAEAELEASDKTTYQYLQDNKRMRSPSVAPAVDFAHRSPSRGRSPSVTVLSDSESGDAANEQDEEDQDKSDTFHLTVRSSRSKDKDKDISLLVRPTTKCGAIVRAFLKKAGLEAEYPMDASPAKGRGRAGPRKVPVLSVDGDRMDAEAEIGIADLEDGDQVEVVGL